MSVVDLTEEYEDLYCHCLEDWSEEMKEAGTLKRQWYERMKSRGLRVKLALDDRGTVGGMIQYGPIENVAIDGSGLTYIYCIWVHGHRRGRGNFQRRGMGSGLLEAAEEDARGLGAKGIVAWGLALPLFMRASWFKRHGYIEVDRAGLLRLLWKPFSDRAVPPRWLGPKKRPEGRPDRVVVTCLQNGWCPAGNLACERAKRAAKEFGDRVIVREIDAFEREVGLAWGASDALFIDQEQVRTGPPPSYARVRRTIAKAVRRMGRRRGA